jgi:mannose-1-phosphate guanylyltransferase/mannose-1-phosphate guanylyltransferase/mannose-6-phosphate isomerase
MFDDCIIMAGGSGTRLWPASNSRRPKQFLPLSGEEGQSFFSTALERALALTRRRDGRVIVIAGKNHAPQVSAACAPFGEEEKKRMILIPEPEAKNTAPAIACGAVFAERSLEGGTGGGRSILVLTSDHIIGPLDIFKADAELAAHFTRQGKLAVFGIPPAGPETGYGYIEAGDALPCPAGKGGGAGKARAFAVKSFREKPGRAAAENFVAAGCFYWNSGMFAFSTPFMLEEFRRSAPEVLAPFEKLGAPGGRRVENGLTLIDNWPGLGEAYREAESISIDYAVAEKCRESVVIPARFNWIDIGNWDEYAKLLKHTGSEVYSAGAEDCFVDSDIPVALAGVEGLIVSLRSGRDGSPPSLLIAKKGESQRLREIVDQIKAAGRTELL